MNSRRDLRRILGAGGQGGQFRSGPHRRERIANLACRGGVMRTPKARRLNASVRLVVWIDPGPGFVRQTVSTAGSKASRSLEGSTTSGRPSLQAAST